MVHRDVVLDVNATGAVNGDAPAEGVPDAVRPDKGVRPVRVHVQGHVIVHRIGGQHEHLFIANVFNKIVKTFDSGPKYRVTIHLGTNLPLTPKQRLRFST